MLVFESVSKDYPSPEGGPPVSVLREAALTVRAGESVAITGPSGSGKSTLLQLAGALVRPDSGRILFCGNDIGEMSESALTALRAREIGFVFQLHHLLPQLSVLENVLLPTLSRAAGEAAVGARGRAMSLLDRVGLGARLGHRPGELSGGERQRAAVARALINQPRLVLADEPTGSLDHAAAVALGELLAELHREQGTTLLVVTHSDELAARMGRRLELRDGRLR
jgi:lipoprotein-releasing system ATP-binding protein